MNAMWKAHIAASIEQQSHNEDPQREDASCIPRNNPEIQRESHDISIEEDYEQMENHSNVRERVDHELIPDAQQRTAVNRSTLMVRAQWTSLQRAQCQTMQKK